MGNVLLAATIIGAAAGLVGLVVAWFSLRASLRAERAAQTADEVAREVRGALRTESATSGLGEIFRQSMLLQQAAEEHSIELARHLLLDIASRLERWHVQYAGLRLGRPAQGQLQDLKGLLKSCHDLLVEQQPHPDDRDELRGAVRQVHLKLASLLGIVEDIREQKHGQAAPREASNGSQ